MLSGVTGIRFYNERLLVDGNTTSWRCDQRSILVTADDSVKAYASRSTERSPTKKDDDPKWPNQRITILIRTNQPATS